MLLDTSGSWSDARATSECKAKETRQGIEERDEDTNSRHGSKRRKMRSQNCCSYSKSTNPLRCVPGNTAVVETLKADYENARDPLKSWSQTKALKSKVDVSDIASLLKMYLRSLEAPLIPFDLGPDFVAAATMREGKEALFKTLFHQIPRSNVAVLEQLLPFLGRVSERAEQNKMNTKNLAMVFGPTLLPPSPSSSDLNKMMMDTKGPILVVEYFLLHHRDVLPATSADVDATGMAPAHAVSVAGVAAVESILDMLPAGDPQRVGVERTLEALRSGTGNGGGSSSSISNSGSSISAGGTAAGATVGGAGEAPLRTKSGPRPLTVWIEPPSGRTPGTPGRQRKAAQLESDAVQRRVIPGTPPRARRESKSISGIDWV